MFVISPLHEFRAEQLFTMGNFIVGYSYSVEWSEEEQQYVGLCKEFPHLSHFDDSEQNAQTGIENLVSDAVNILKERNLPVPKSISE